MICSRVGALSNFKRYHTIAMKRSLAILLLLVVASLPCAAQTIGAGVRAGYNIALAKRGGDTVGDPNSGLLLGAGVILELFPSFALQAGIQYVQKNNRFELVLPGGETRTEDYEFDYLELPISMTLFFRSESPKVYGILGTTLGTLLSATGTTSEEGSTDSADYSASLDPMDMSLDVGAGVGFDLFWPLEFIVEAKYSFGLVDISSSTDPRTQFESWRARDLKLMAGLFFTL